mgnify:CR=1 FL=1
MNDLAQDLLRKHAALAQKRRMWEPLWQDVADFIIPIRENIDNNRDVGFKFGDKIFDGTAVWACKLMVDGLHGYLLSPAIQWFKLAMENKDLDALHEIRIWLQGAEETIYKTFNRSGFYDNAWMFLYDGCSIGTACMYMEYDPVLRGVVYETIHPGEIFIEDDIYGNVDTVHRVRNLTAKQAEELFGYDSLPQHVKDLLKTNPYKEEEWLHCVYPRKNWDKSSLLSVKKKYASAWLNKSTGTVVKESGYEMFPYAVWRFYKSGKEANGRSPAMYALQDVKGSNVMSKTLLGAAQMSVDPPLNIPAELIGKVEWRPRGYNYFASADRQVSTINTNINYPIGRDSAEAKQEMIEKHFFVDFFLMLANAERQMTATEVMEKQGEKAIILGASISRLNRESISRTIDLTFDILFRKGIIQPPPFDVEETDGNIQIEYLGPLAQAQKRMFSTQGIKAGIEVAAPIFQLFPETMDLIDADAATGLLLRGYGFPEQGFNEEAKVKNIRDGRRKAKEEQAMAESINTDADTLRSVADANKKSKTNIADMLNHNLESILQ